MRNKMRESHSIQGDLEQLESIRLTATELADARAQWARGEAVAEFIFVAWTAVSALLRRVIAAIVHKTLRYADSFADAAMRASERERDEYLCRAVDTADLERRIRSWQSRHADSRN